MFAKSDSTGWLNATVALAVLMAAPSGMVLAQHGTVKKTQAKRTRAKESGTRSAMRRQPANVEKVAADRIVLNDRKELLGQVDDSAPDGVLTVLARRDLIQTTLPGWVKKWEDAERGVIAAAAAQRRERLAGWRQERPAESVPGDRINIWLNCELSGSSGSASPTPLIAIKLARDEISALERRSDSAAKALRCAWLLGLVNPETTPFADLKDSIAGRGMMLESDESIALDRLLPPVAESANHWLLRRAATEALYDDGLRFIRFGSTILPEPTPGQSVDQAAGISLVEGTIRDVLGIMDKGRSPTNECDTTWLCHRGRVAVKALNRSVARDQFTHAKIANGLSQRINECLFLDL